MWILSFDEAGNIVKHTLVGELFRGLMMDSESEEEMMFRLFCNSEPVASADRVLPKLNKIAIEFNKALPLGKDPLTKEKFRKKYTASWFVKIYKSRYK